MTHTLRQARGYAFEKSIVDSFNQSGWTARSLGGSTSDLPDIVATNSGKQMLFSLECKSTIGDACYVPTDQLIRCYDILRMFDVYSWRYIVLAFKFAKSKTNKKKKLEYWYLVLGDYLNLKNISSVKVKRGGKLTWNVYDEKMTTWIKYIWLKNLDDLKFFEDVDVGYISERKNGSSQ